MRAFLVICTCLLYVYITSGSEYPGTMEAGYFFRVLCLERWRASWKDCIWVCVHSGWLNMSLTRMLHNILIVESAVYGVQYLSTSN